MLRDVEVADAEGEVDGVDVVEMTGTGGDVQQEREQPEGEREPRPCPRRAVAGCGTGRLRLRQGRQPITRSGMRSLRLPVR
jgi:hypothetical protein